MELDWLLRKHIDFEYQKYKLLAYFQKVDESYTATKVFPFFPQLLKRQSQLSGLRASLNGLAHFFPKKLKGISLEAKKLNYESELSFTPEIAVVDSLVEFCIPRFEAYIDEGNQIMETVKEAMVLYPIGITPLYTQEGYLFLKQSSKPETKIYEYSLGVIRSPHLEFTRVKTNYVTTCTWSVANSFESIKSDIIRNRPAMPNPATYAIEYSTTVPEKETLLPVAKKVLVEFIGENY